MTGLIYPDGRPIPSGSYPAAKKADLAREISGPTTTGIRNHYSDVVASGLTPAKLGQLLRAADDGDPDAYLALAEEMEERDLHYRSQLGTRKGALLGIEPQVEAASDDAADQKIADAVREMVGRPQFGELVEDLVDALGKGYAVCEVIWNTKATPWEPVAYKFRDPRWFQFDRVDRTTLRLKDVGSPDGVDLAPGKFVVHVPKLKSGIPIRGGLARLASWCFLLKSYTLKDWAQFAEIYGLPLRVGKYHDGASEDDKRVLLRAVRDIAADAGVIIPDRMMLEFVEAGSTGEPVFGSLADFLNKEVSKGILGQTMSSEDGASLAQAKVHDGVRMDLAKMDSRQLGRTVSAQLVVPFVQFNFGPQVAYPRVTFPIEEPEDLNELADNLVKLVPLGMRVAVSEVRDRFGWPDPDPKEEVLTAPSPPPAAEPVEDASKPPRSPSSGAVARSLRPVCPGCGQRHAIAAAELSPAPLDRLVDAALDEWQPVLDPVRAALEKAFRAATSYEDLRDRLDALAATLPVDQLARTLASMQLIARDAGETGNG
jgi:phage gp29-like protein